MQEMPFRSLLLLSSALIPLGCIGGIASADIISTGSSSPFFNIPVLAGSTTSGFVTVGGSGAGTIVVNGLSTLTLPGMNIGGNQGANTIGTGSVTVSGAGAQIIMTGAPENLIAVGRFGTTSSASMSILAGGIVDIRSGFGMRIGRGDPVTGTNGATGTVLIDGAGSKLLIGGADQAGQANGIALGRDGGVGTLTIRSGGVAILDGSAATGSTFGSFLSAGGQNPSPGFAGSSGSATVSVDGVGSLLALRGDGGSLAIANAGAATNATLAVTNGGRVESVFFGAGRNGSTGTVVIEGPASSVLLFGKGRLGEAPGGTFGGEGGTGTLTLRNGATLTVDNTTATQPGGGFTFGNGAGSTGAFNMESGATATKQYISLGNKTGGTATVSISGATTQLNLVNKISDGSSAGLGVGRAGTGTFTISGGAKVVVNDNGESTLADINIGGNQLAANDVPDPSIGNGTLRITGAGSRLDMIGVGSSIEVGRFGTASRGTLEVSDGGALRTQAIRIGRGAGGGGEGSTGTMVIDNASVLVDGLQTDGRGGQVSLGREGGTGTLTVRNGGRLTIDGSAATTDGSNMNIGGRFTSTPSATDVSSTGTGTVVVTGPGSKIELTGIGNSVSVGRYGTGTQGTLEVRAGGVFEARSMTVGRGDDVANGARGTVLVDGGGSALNLIGVGRDGNAPFLTIGRDIGGVGTLTIDNGGRVSIDGAAATLAGTTTGINLARDAGSTGAMVVDRGSHVDIVGSAIANPQLTVGRIGAGTLTIDRGSVVTLDGTASTGSQFGVFSIGGNGGTESNPGSDGTVLVTGAGSKLRILGEDAGGHVGRNAGATGRMTIANGAELATTGLQVARNTGSTGVLTVDGAGSAVNLVGDAAGVNGGFLVVGRGGNGTATLKNGAVVNIDGSAVGAGPTVNDNRSGLIIGGTPFQAGGSGTVNVESGATVNVTSNIIGARAGLLTLGMDVTGTTPSSGQLNITGGGRVLFDSIGATAIGYSAGSSGIVTVDGAGSLLQAGEFLGVGMRKIDGVVEAGGTGTLTVRGGGTAQGTEVNVGTGGTVQLQSGGRVIGAVANRGAITVDGGVIAGSVVNRGTLGFVGDLAADSSSNLRGTLETLEGGVTSAGRARFASNATVDGAGSALNAGSFLGVATSFGGTDTGSSTLTLRNGGTAQAVSVVVGGGGAVALQSGGTLTGAVDNRGSVTVDGGVLAGGMVNRRTLSFTGDLVANGAGNLRGSLDVLAGGIASALRTSLGNVATVDGTGSRLDAGSILGVGASVTGTDAGSGTLTVRNGAVAQSANVVIGGAGSALVQSGGRLEGSITNRGTLDVAGGTVGDSIVNQGTLRLSTTRSAGALNVANSGTVSVGEGFGTPASVTMNAGATMTVGGPVAELVVARGTGSNGTVHVEGAGTQLDAGSFLGIGIDKAGAGGGTGLVTVSAGGRVEASTVRVGAASTLDLAGGTVDGAIVNEGTVRVANVLDGGTLAITSNGGGRVTIGGPGAPGTTELRNGATLDVKGTSGKLYIAAEGGSTGALKLSSPGVFTSTVRAQNVVLSRNADGTAGGTSLLELRDGVVEASHVDAYAGGTIAGTGIIFGGVTLHAGAVLRPGFSPGTITINGDLNLLDGAVLQLDFEERADRTVVKDLIEVTGQIVSDALAKLEIVLGGTATIGDLVGVSVAEFFAAPAEPDLMTIFEGDNLLVSTKDGSKSEFVVRSGDLVFVRDLPPDTDPTPPGTDVPAPPALWSLLVGLSAVAWWRSGAARGRRRVSGNLTHP